LIDHESHIREKLNAGDMSEEEGTKRKRYWAWLQALSATKGAPAAIALWEPLLPTMNQEQHYEEEFLQRKVRIEREFVEKLQNYLEMGDSTSAQCGEAQPFQVAESMG
jgi:hypothetical protein